MIVLFVVAKDWKLPRVHQQGTSLMKYGFYETAYVAFKRIRCGFWNHLQNLLLGLRKARCRIVYVIFLSKRMCILCKCIISLEKIGSGNVIISGQRIPEPGGMADKV